MKLLEVNNISKSFRSVKILDDVTFAINNGSIVAVTGENGVGKSTFFKYFNFGDKSSEYCRGRSIY